MQFDLEALRHPLLSKRFSFKIIHLIQWFLWWNLALGQLACSTDRTAITPPLDPTVEDHHSNPDAAQHDHKDVATPTQPPNPSTPSLTANTPAPTLATSEQRTPTDLAVAPLFSAQTCESIYTKAADILTNHVSYSQFSDLDQAWSQRMCRGWIQGLDNYQLYWTKHEAQQLMSRCGQRLHRDFQQHNCQALELVPAAWLAQRHAKWPQLNKIINLSFQTPPTQFQRGILPVTTTLTHRAQAAKQTDLRLLKALGYPDLQNIESTVLPREYAAFISAHHNYGAEELADLTLRAFTNSLDHHSSYGLGKYGSAHATESARIVALAQRYPFKLVQIGRDWLVTIPSGVEVIHHDEDEAEEHEHEEDKENKKEEIDLAAGDKLIGIYDTTSDRRLGDTSSHETANYLPVEFLAARKYELMGYNIELEVQRTAEDNTATTFRVPLVPEHEDSDDVIELHTTLYEFTDITKDSLATIATLKLAHFHSHDGGLSQHTMLARELIRLINDYEVNGMVLDLRGNQHGRFQDAVNATQLFIPKQLNAQSSHLLHSLTKDRFIPHHDNEHHSIETPLIHWKSPIVILVDSVTGGASELFSQALKQYAGAVIVGGPITEGFGSQQTYFAPTAPWEGYFITTRIFGLANGSTWNCWGVGVDVPWTTQHSTTYNSRTRSCPQQPAQQPNYQPGREHQELIAQLNENSHLRHHLNPTIPAPLDDSDLIRAALIAVDEYFLTRHSTKLSGRYNLITTIAIPSLNAPDNPAQLLYPQVIPYDNSGPTQDIQVPPESRQPASPADISLSYSAPNQLHSNNAIHQVEDSTASFSNEAGWSSPAHAAANNREYTLLIDNHYSLKICAAQPSLSGNTTGQPECTDAFISATGKSFTLPQAFYTDYGIKDAQTDANNFLHKIHINHEERRLFYKSLGMGMTGGAFSGGTAASPGVLGSIAGVSVIDSTMDATAGVPGHVDEKIGVPRVAAITSAGTATGSIIGVIGVITSSKAAHHAFNQFTPKLSGSLVTRLPLFRKVIGGVIVLTGIHMAFLSDANSLAKNPWHPFNWFARAIWQDPSLDFAEAWPLIVQGQASSNLNKHQLIAALESLKSLLMARKFATHEDLTSYCLPHQQCYQFISSNST